MKAVVVEIKNNLAAVLSDDGCIVKLRNENYAIGQVMELKESTALKKPTKFFALAASAAAAVVVLSVSTWAYYTPYSYVSLDVNPSIGYSVNRFDKVIDAKAVNGDGTEILENLNLKNKSIANAVKATIKEIAANGYFDGETPGGIVITTSSESPQKGEQLADTLEQGVQEETKNIGEDIQLEVQNVALERVHQAEELGVTPGKLNLVEKLEQTAVGMSSVNVKQWLNMPVKDIMKATKEFKEMTKAEVKAEAKNGASQAAENSKKDTSSESSKSSSSAAVKASSSSKSENANSGADKAVAKNENAQPNANADKAAEKNENAQANGKGEKTASSAVASGSSTAESSSSKSENAQGSANADNSNKSDNAQGGGNSNKENENASPNADSTAAGGSGAEKSDNGSDNANADNGKSDENKSDNANASNGKSDENKSDNANASNGKSDDKSDNGNGKK